MENIVILTICYKYRMEYKKRKMKNVLLIQKNTSYGIIIDLENVYLHRKNIINLFYETYITVYYKSSV